MSLKCTYVWRMVSTPAHARHLSTVITHAWHMVSAPAHAHVAQMYSCLAHRPRASSQHCTHAWHMVSTRALAQHRTHASQMVRTPTHFWLRTGLSPEKAPIKQGWMDEKCAAPRRESACKCTRRDIYIYIYMFQAVDPPLKNGKKGGPGGWPVDGCLFLFLCQSQICVPPYSF